MGWRRRTGRVCHELPNSPNSSQVSMKLYMQFALSEGTLPRNAESKSSGMAPPSVLCTWSIAEHASSKRSSNSLRTLEPGVAMGRGRLEE